MKSNLILNFLVVSYYNVYRRLPYEQFDVCYKRDPVRVQLPVDFVAPFGCVSKCLKPHSGNSYYQ